jgi:glyoxylase-like metal-dependent hydrolase (beta-lactamase superfamily II)
MRRFGIALLLAGGVWAGWVQAQESPVTETVALRELIPGHYMFTGGRYNGGVIATSAGAIAVDAVGPEAVSRQQRELIQSRLGQPVRYLVSSTFHDNYSKGNVSFRDVTKIGSALYRTNLLALMRSENVPADEQAARLPTETFDDKMTVYLGGKEVQILYLGKGHTASDSVVYVPQDRIAYLSELLFYDEYPNMADGYGVAWIETLEKIEALDADIFVPGHGTMPENPRETRDGLRRARLRLVATRDAVEREIARGATEDEAVSAIQFPEYEGLRSYPAQKDVAVRRMYQELKGQLR